MDEMKEIIDEKTVEVIMTVVLFGGPCVGLVIGALVGLVQKQFRKRALQGLGLGCFGILNWVMWKYYSWTVRYDPETGYVGLHKVSVLLINMAVFVALGAIIGTAWGLLANRAHTRTQALAGADGQMIAGPAGSTEQETTPQEEG